MNIILHTDVVVALCANPATLPAGTADALTRIRKRGGRTWLYAGAVSALLRDLANELARQQPEMDQTAAKTEARQRLDKFAAECQWLAATAGDGEGIFEEEDPETAQLARAASRLGTVVRLLTADPALLKACEWAGSPESLLRECEGAAEPPPLPFIDLATQQSRLRGILEERILRVFYHGQYILGPEVSELEKRLAEYAGVNHCVGVASGTDSLQIALMALGISPGDEVITVPYTWISSAEVIALVGAKPVFVDIEPVSWNMDPQKLEAAITPRTKAIMPVGIFGQTADMKAVNAIAARHGNIPVLEDAAQSFGATHHGKRSCALSTIGSTSFFPSKPLGGYGDGGALFTDDGDLAQKMRQIRVHGQSKKHHHPILGFNGRLDSLQAAVVLAKMEVFDDEIRLRQEVAEEYGRQLTGTDSGITLPTVAKGNTSVWAQYTVLSADRDNLASRLKADNIPAVSYYAVPLHLQPVFAGLGHAPGDFPVSEKIASQGISLPMNPYLAKEDIRRVARAMAK